MTGIPSKLSDHAEKYFTTLSLASSNQLLSIQNDCQSNQTGSKNKIEKILSQRKINKFLLVKYFFKNKLTQDIFKIIIYLKI